jgi:RHS repeat-associated protein
VTTCPSNPWLDRERGTGVRTPSASGREDDGTGLYYYRARYYDPGRGRFISEDPIGLQGGINLYSYVDANPIIRTDPLGLQAIPFPQTGPLPSPIPWPGTGDSQKLARDTLDGIRQLDEPLARGLDHILKKIKAKRKTIETIEQPSDPGGSCPPPDMNDPNNFLKACFGVCQTVRSHIARAACYASCIWMAFAGPSPSQ